MSQQSLLSHPLVARAIGITQRAAEARKKHGLPDDQPITREVLIDKGLLKPPAPAAQHAPTPFKIPGVPGMAAGLGVRKPSDNNNP